MQKIAELNNNNNNDKTILYILFVLYFSSFFSYLFWINTKGATPIENYLISFFISIINAVGIFLLLIMIFKNLENTYSFLYLIFKKIKSVFIFISIYLIIPFFIVLIITTYFIRPFSISGESMNQTYQNGDGILGIVFGYNNYIPFTKQTLKISLNNIKRGDVIFFKMGDVFYVKRIIALPSDIVSYNDETKLYTINGENEKNDFYSINIESSEKNKKDVFTEVMSIKNELGDIGYGDIKINIAKKSGFYNNLNITYDETRRYSLYRIPSLHQVQIKNYKVPENFFFVGGDNRLSSVDSRYFGPIPFDLVRGKAIFKMIDSYPFIQVVE